MVNSRPMIDYFPRDHLQNEVSGWSFITHYSVCFAALHYIVLGFEYMFGVFMILEEHGWKVYSVVMHYFAFVWQCCAGFRVAV